MRTAAVSTDMDARPLVPGALFVLLSLGLWLGSVFAGLGAVLVAIMGLTGGVGLMGSGAVPLGLGLAILMGAVAWSLGLTSLGLSQLRRALITAQESGPFWGQTTELLRQGARSLLLAGIVTVGSTFLLGLLLTTAQPLLSRNEDLLSTILSETYSTSDWLNMLTGGMLGVALPLLLLGLADWTERGSRLRQQQREVV